MIRVEISRKEMVEIRHKLGKVNEGKLKKVLSKAVNETAKQMRRNVSNYVRRDYTVTLGGTTKGMSIKKATTSKPAAILKVKGSKTPLLNFSVTNKKRIATSFQGGQQDKKGNLLYHKVRVKKSNKLKRIMTAFIAKNHLIIRPKKLVGKKSHEPKDWLAFGPSMPDMVGSQSVWKNLSKDGNKILKARLDKAVRDVVEGYR